MPSFVLFSEAEDPTDLCMELRAIDPPVPEGFSGVRGGIDRPHCFCAWHCGTDTPLEKTSDSSGNHAIVFGDAIAEHSADRLKADQLLALALDMDAEKLAVSLARYSGFYAWVVLFADGSVQCGADPFGLFPLYYFACDGSFGLSTSLAPLRKHPKYDARLDPVGLSRYLIENGFSGGRTLEVGGRRLEMVQSIKWSRPQEAVMSFKNPAPGVGVQKDELSEAEAIERSVDLSRRAVERHLQSEPDTILLSGGLDSRHLLALAVEQGHRPVTLTIGENEGPECLCAKEVAKRLKLPWHPSGPFTEDPDRVVLDELRLLSLGGGFNGMSFWNQDSNWQRGARCLNGVYLDVVYAPSWASNSSAAPGSFDYNFESWVSKFGMRPDALRSLFSDNEFRDAVDTAMAEFFTEWEAMPGDPNEVSWQTMARYRSRSHLGGYLWKNSFRSWPISPALDVPLVDGIRRIPSRFFKNRWLQKETFVRLRPDLASIPLATWGSRPRPIVKNWRSSLYRRKWRMRRKWRKRFGAKPCEAGVALDTRHLTWKVAQNLALSNESHWTGIFRKDLVEDYIRGVEFDTAPGDPEGGESKAARRTLLGSVCWLSASRSSGAELSLI